MGGAEASGAGAQASGGRRGRRGIEWRRVWVVHRRPEARAAERRGGGKPICTEARGKEQAEHLGLVLAPPPAPGVVLVPPPVFVVAAAESRRLAAPCAPPHGSSKAIDHPTRISLDLGGLEKKGLQNEECLKIMFEDLRNTSDDHFGASSGVIPHSPTRLEGDDEDDNDDGDSDPEEITPPPKAKGKRVQGAQIDKGKKPKTSGRIWIQDLISKIVDCNERSAASVESFARREHTSGFSIKEVMAIVKQCGATPGTKEFFIASELFTKRAEREMFMTMETPA